MLSPGSESTSLEIWPIPEALVWPATLTPEEVGADRKVWPLRDEKSVGVLSGDEEELVAAIERRTQELAGTPAEIGAIEVGPARAEQPKDGAASVGASDFETGADQKGWWARVRTKKVKSVPPSPAVLAEAAQAAQVERRSRQENSELEINRERRVDKDKSDSILKGVKAGLHQRILQEMALRPDWSQEVARPRVLEIVDTELAMLRPLLRRQGERAVLTEALLNDVFGLGAIQQLVDDPEVSEIMVNGINEVFAEREGRVSLTEVKFDDEERLMSVIDRIVASVGRRVDESFPMADARLADGSRVNVVLPPLSLKGPCLTIRKFREEHYTDKQLVEIGAANDAMMAFLRAAVQGKANILITGGTSSGKTTLLNILSGFISNDERIVTVEDAAELRLNQRHVVPLETRSPNSEGKGQINIRELVRNSLRMRPDRIVVGEVRGAEALDMIQAMNTGHDGSMSTVHANSSADALHRLEAMAMMAGVEIPSESIRFQICSAVGLVVNTQRVTGGARKIVDVSEVMRNRGEMTTQSIFVYKQTGVDNEGNAMGTHMATGVVPNCLGRIRERGGVVDEEIFKLTASSERRDGERRAARHNGNKVVESPISESPISESPEIG